MMHNARGVHRIKHPTAVAASPSSGLTFCRDSLTLLYFRTSPNVRKGGRGGRLSVAWVEREESPVEAAMTTAWLASSSGTSRFPPVGMAMVAK